jgi:hypothetical protein
MKKIKLLLIFVSFTAFIGCEDKDSSFPTSGNPEIVVETNEIYGGPNKKFEIKGLLNDDLGLKSVNIKISELQLDKVIVFSTNPLIKSYNLGYSFLIPEGKLTTDNFEIELLLTDVSGNVVTKKINLRLDGDFDAPILTNLKPINGSVVFKSANTTIKISFTAEDITGIDKLIISCEALGINDIITVGGLKIYEYSKSFSIPSDLKTYDIIVTAKDNFLTPNEKTTKINFTVADGLTEMYLVDLPLSSNLTKDAFGVPMRFHSKSGNDFSFKYYADSDNKKIFLLGQEASFEPNCFGLSSSGSLENSTTTNPIVLPTKGYYIVNVNPINLSYSVTPFTPTKAPINLSSTPVYVHGAGFVGEGWTGQPNTLPVAADPSNPYRFSREIVLTGGDVQMTVASKNWGPPFWRLDTFGAVPFNGGANATYNGVASGTYIFTIDTELERSTLILK